MKHIVSVSLGSSSRDHKVETTFLNENFIIERRGVDGDIRKAKSILQELDGTVDAIGLGGLDVYLSSRKGRYALKEGLELLNILKKTPAVDGSGLKNTLEPEILEYIKNDSRFPLKDKNVLMVCAMDRLGLAEAFTSAGCNMMFGDIMFALGKNQPIHSLDELGEFADKVIPEISKLPLAFIYPMGKKQMAAPENKYPEHYEWADYIAGDFHFIRKHLPPKIDGKIIITNTVTDEDIEDLKQRGTAYVITTTPELKGRSFGTNVLEAVLISIMKKPWEEITQQEYLDLIRKLELKPRIEELKPQLLKI